MTKMWTAILAGMALLPGCGQDSPRSASASSPAQIPGAQPVVVAIAPSAAGPAGGSEAMAAGPAAARPQPEAAPAGAVKVPLVIAGDPAVAAGPHEGHMGSRSAETPPPGVLMAFDKMPAFGTKAICPVSKEAFTVNPRTQFSTYSGKTYVFCCADCKPEFDRSPAKFAAHN
jgi:YHS domain-containing protein